MEPNFSTHKILFIDIDDCLLMLKGDQSIQEFPKLLETRNDFLEALNYYSTKLSKEHMNRIKNIAEKNVKFIIHSTWRYFYEIQDFQNTFQLYGIENAIIDPPFISNQFEDKSVFIQKWINFGIKDYAVIDNDLFTIPEQSRFVLIDEKKGFDNNSYNQVCNILQINP